MATGLGGCEGERPTVVDEAEGWGFVVTMVGAEMTMVHDGKGRDAAIVQGRVVLRFFFFFFGSIVMD